MISNKTWVGWIVRTVSAVAAWFVGAVVSYQQALGSIPRPPQSPGLPDVAAWVVTGSDPGAVIAAILSGLGMVATAYQSWQPKPYTAKQGLLDRAHQNDSFAAAEGQQQKRQDETKESLAELASRIATLTAIVSQTAPQQAGPMSETLTELASSGDVDEVAIARQAVEQGPTEAADALMAEVNLDQTRLAERVRQAARLYAPFSPSKAMEAYQQATDLDPEDVWSWIELGRLRLQYSSLAAARACFGAALQRAVDERDRMVLHGAFGDVLVSEGKLQDARREYEAGLAIAETLAAREPANAQWQRDLSISYARLGQVEKAAGNLEAARERFEASLAIAETLAAREPANAKWQRDLSVSYERLGMVEEAAGNLEAARERSEASLAIAETLAAREPANTQWQRDLSVSYNKLGDVEVVAGNLGAARERFEASLAIAETLAAREPANTKWQRDLSVSHNKLGDVEVAVGNLEAARERFEASLAIRETLAAREPANTEWQRDLFISNAKLAQLAEARQDSDAALTASKRAELIMAALVVANADHPGFARDLKQVRAHIGRISMNLTG